MVMTAVVLLITLFFRTYDVEKSLARVNDYAYTETIELKLQAGS